MIRLSDIPPFIGDGSQDADMWQQDFLSSTAHYSDEAVARLFISKLAHGSPAHTLIDSLPDAVKGSWFKLERVFRKEWLPSDRVFAPTEDPWEAFERHVLTEEMIFEGSQHEDNVSEPRRIIASWVDEHLRLGRSTGGSEDCLVRVTKVLLPIFIRAMLSLKPKPESLADLCSIVRQVPRDLLMMQWAHCNERWRREERLSAIERRLKEISERVDGLSKGTKALTGTNPSVTSFMGEASNLRAGFQAIADHSPLLQNGAPVVSNLSTILRGPEMLLSRNEQIGIAQRTIDKMLQYLMGSYVFRDLADNQWQDVWSAVAIHDRMMGSTEYKAKVEEALSKYCSPPVSRSYWLDTARLLWGICLVHGFQSYGTPIFLQVAKEHWNLITSRLVMKNQSTARRHINVCLDDIQLHQSPDGSTSLSGGVFKDSFEGTEIAAFETTLYMSLSAHLAQCTGEEHYKDNAVLTANCVKNYMIDPETSVVKDCTVDAWNGKVATMGTPSVFLTGVFLEALSILASIDTDNTWQKLAFKTASASMRVQKWHGSGWVLFPTANRSGLDEGVGNSKGSLIRGLRQVHRLAVRTPEIYMAMYDYNEEGLEEDDLSFRQGDLIEVVDRCSGKWWYGKTKDVIKLVPFNYVERISKQDNNEPAFSDGHIEGDADTMDKTRHSCTRIRSSIRRYVNAQFNALRDFAQIGDSYRAIWVRSNMEASASGQMAAIDLISAVIELNQGWLPPSDHNQ
ncbi:hypothetical protein FRC03_000843 [Tulasnella sp. 419]|nr:hypothetical protein FRC03_000843 [Tulasnella sp. 419]